MAHIYSVSPIPGINPNLNQIPCTKKPTRNVDAKRPGTWEQFVGNYCRCGFCLGFIHTGSSRSVCLDYFGAKKSSGEGTHDFPTLHFQDFSGAFAVSFSEG